MLLLASEQHEKGTANTVIVMSASEGNASPGIDVAADSSVMQRARIEVIDDLDEGGIESFILSISSIRGSLILKMRNHEGSESLCHVSRASIASSSLSFRNVYLTAFGMNTTLLPTSLLLTWVETRLLSTDFAEVSFSISTRKVRS
ncbi:hypothetical protein RRF57_011607 [Xylaria bambusicola]|uniref:Uncharacterized protein n=1 Tax=Xylaria bambusicola TaxID=326684 RepID=A0AAN7V0V0_9PEZI